MTLYLLDTDTLTLHQHQHPKVTAAILAHANDRNMISTVTVEEQIGGWSAAARSAKTDADHDFAAVLLMDLIDSWAHFARVPFLTPARRRFETLLKAKLNVGGKDLRIASIALGLGATVVTHNRRDFGRVLDLAIEDWSVWIVVSPVLTHMVPKIGMSPR